MSEMSVKERLDAIVSDAMDRIGSAEDLNTLNDVRISILGN